MKFETRRLPSPSSFTDLLVLLSCRAAARAEQLKRLTDGDTDELIEIGVLLKRYERMAQSAKSA